MALHSCPECGHRISERTPFCPGCGASQVTPAEGLKIGVLVAVIGILGPIVLALIAGWPLIQAILDW